MMSTGDNDRALSSLQVLTPYPLQLNDGVGGTGPQWIQPERNGKLTMRLPRLLYLVPCRTATRGC